MEEKNLMEWKRHLEIELQDITGFRKILVDYRKNSLKLYFTVLTPARKEEVYKVFEREHADEILFSFEEVK